MKPTNSNEAWKKARAYFHIENEPNLVLHHKDETLKTHNVERYNEWRPEDLEILTRAEHAKLHHKGTKRGARSNETKAKISNKLTGVSLSKERAEKAGRGHYKKVLCVETNEEFDSLKSAAEKYKGRVRYSIKIGRAVKGLTFKYI